MSLIFFCFDLFWFSSNLWRNCFNELSCQLGAPLLDWGQTNIRFWNFWIGAWFPFNVFQFSHGVDHENWYLKANKLFCLKEICQFFIVAFSSWTMKTSVMKTSVKSSSLSVSYSLNCFHLSWLMNYKVFWLLKLISNW